MIRYPNIPIRDDWDADPEDGLILDKMDGGEYRSYTKHSAVNVHLSFQHHLVTADKVRMLDDFYMKHRLNQQGVVITVGGCRYLAKFKKKPKDDPAGPVHYDIDVEMVGRRL